MLRKFLFLVLFTPIFAIAQMRIIPHLTRPSGGFTGLLSLDNPTQAEVTFLLTAYDGAGSLVGRADGVVPARAQRELDPVALFQSDAAAWVAVSEETGAEVGVIYRANGEGRGPAHAAASADTSRGWRFRGGNPQVTWDGLSVVNPGEEATPVIVRQLSAGGQVLAERIIAESLAPRARLLVVLTGLLTDDENAIFEVTAEQPLAMIALRGALTNDFLWQNALTAFAPVPATFSYSSENAFPNLAVAQPVALASPPDGSGRLFLVEQSGRIRILPEDEAANGAEVFLDLTGRVRFEGEMGLLGLAFHPDYAGNGYFYVNYTRNEGAGVHSIISRFQMQPGDPDRADAASERVLLDVAQPFANHNGGQLAFGPDGLLYIGLGDGGSGGDPQQNGQDVSTLLGALLRVDVDQPANGLNYGIPADNPLAGEAPPVRPEIYAWGFRNPWRFSFDGQDLWVADVGQDLYEEIDLVVAGGNYGWRIMEGEACFSPANGCDTTGLQLPIYTYGRDLGASITGGYVYRGKRLPGLFGAYIFGDFVSGRVWALRRDPATLEVDVTELFQINRGVLVSFGQDDEGELYICDYNGLVRRIVAETLIAGP